MSRKQFYISAAYIEDPNTQEIEIVVKNKKGKTEAIFGVVKEK